MKRGSGSRSWTDATKRAELNDWLAHKVRPMFEQRVLSATECSDHLARRTSRPRRLGPVALQNKHLRHLSHKSQRASPPSAPAMRAAISGSCADHGNRRLTLRWMNELKRNAARFAIDCEIGIERTHGVTLVDLRHPHDAGIGERHRSVPIFVMQL